jgi:hypothetical protein
MPDSPLDLYYFLRTLHDAGWQRSLLSICKVRFLTTYTRSRSTFAILGGVLCLSAKYDVPYFKQRAYENLTPLFPITLAAWDKLYFDRPHILTDPTWSFTVVQLFRDTGPSALLPTALYAACFTSGGLDNVLNGVLRDDGSHDELSEEDKNVCSEVRETLLLAQCEFIPNSLLI